MSTVQVVRRCGKKIRKRVEKLYSSVESDISDVDADSDSDLLIEPTKPVKVEIEEEEAKEEEEEPEPVPVPKKKKVPMSDTLRPRHYTAAFVGGLIEGGMSWNVKSWRHFPRQARELMDRYGGIKGEVALVALQCCLFQTEWPGLRQFKEVDVMMTPQQPSIELPYTVRVDKIMPCRLDAYDNALGLHVRIHLGAQGEEPDSFGFDKSGDMMGRISEKCMKMLKTRVYEGKQWRSTLMKPLPDLEVEPSKPIFFQNKEGKKVEIPCDLFTRFKSVDHAWDAGLVAAHKSTMMDVSPTTMPDTMRAMYSYGALVGYSAMWLFQHLFFAESMPRLKFADVLAPNKDVLFTSAVRLRRWDAEKQMVTISHPKMGDDCLVDCYINMKPLKEKTARGLEPYGEFMYRNGRFEKMTFSLLAFLLKHGLDEDGEEWRRIPSE